MLNTFLFSAVHLGMQLNTGQDEVEEKVPIFLGDLSVVELQTGWSPAIL